MTDPTSLLVAGDWHGDPVHAMYCFEQALNNNVDAIFQVGDFGFWEHMPNGGSFLDVVSTLAVENDMPCYWIDGNHESHTLLRALYGPGGRKHKMTPEGFWEIRPGLFYVPRGTRWVWNGAHLMGLGGAYSVDKDYRLAREQGIASPRWGWTWEHARVHPATGPNTMWWPEEELTDDEVAVALADPTPLDVLFTHDKPRAAAPKWNRKNILECFPNQDKIQTVVNALKPKLLVHGHLHFPYQDQIRCGENDEHTLVMGLHCNPDDPKASQRNREQQRQDSWTTLKL